MEPTPKGSEAATNGSFDDYMTRLSKQSQELSDQIQTILKHQNHRTSEDESYSTATPSPPAPQVAYRHYRQRVSSPDSETFGEWRRPQQRYHRSRSVPSLRQTPRYYGPEDSGSSVTEATQSGSDDEAESDISGSQSQQEYSNNHQLVHRRNSWDPMQPAPFDARMQLYDRHPHTRTQSGPLSAVPVGPMSAGPILQRRPTLGYGQPEPFPQPEPFFADPMSPDIPMMAMQPPMMFIPPPPPPPPPPPMGCPPEFMAMPNADSGIMSTGMMNDPPMLDILEGPMPDMMDGSMHPPPAPPGHDASTSNTQYQRSAPELYQPAETMSKNQSRRQRMIGVIKQKLARAYENRSIKYGMISQRMYEQGQGAQAAAEAATSTQQQSPPSQQPPSRRGSLRRARSLRQQPSNGAGFDKSEPMMWCFRPQRKLASLPWEPFDRASQMQLTEAANAGKQCTIQDSHFAQPINVVPSAGYGITTKNYGHHAVYSVALLDPTQQVRTIFFCIPVGRTRVNTGW
ncbi:hypothetical protein NQZ79_g7491 [Umbelopsis isabellina]|nr:hypothetical protein NQZ79_g7491 [Umbelopsis isabellina]